MQYGPQEFQGLAAAARARHAGTGRTSSVILSSRRARCGLSSTRPQAHCRSAPFSKALARHCQTSRLAGALTQYAPKRSSAPCCRAPVAPPLTTVPTCRRHLHWSHLSPPLPPFPAARRPRAGLDTCRLTNLPQPRWPGAQGAPARGPLGGNRPSAPKGVRGGPARHPTGHPAGYRGGRPPVNPDWVVARIPSIKGRSGTPQPPATGFSLC